MFINNSKQSLKCVLLYNDNKYGSILIVHSTKMTEEQETITLVLQDISYKWLICVDVKMVNFLLDQLSGYINYACFSVSRIVDLSMSTGEENNGLLGENVVVGKMNVIAKALVDWDLVILPLLHIKLGLMKLFLKVLSKKGAALTICGKNFQHWEWRS